jgi:hypothetical protein
MRKILIGFFACLVLVLPFSFVHSDTGFPLTFQPGTPLLAVTSFNAAQNVGAYTVLTASSQDVWVDSCAFYVSTTVTGLTSVTLQTDDTTATTVLNTVLVAALTGGKPLTSYTGPLYLPSGKHIQASVVGTNGTAGTIKVVCRYTPTAAGGLLS